MAINRYFGSTLNIRDVKIGKGSKIWNPELVNLYECVIGEDTTIGPFVEIQKEVYIGNKCKISSHSFICEGVTIGNECFIGHGVIFINDRYPKATNKKGELQTREDWKLEPTIIEDKVSIGSGCVIMCGVRIGKGSIIGAGSIVTKDVKPNTLYRNILSVSRDELL